MTIRRFVPLLALLVVAACSDDVTPPTVAPDAEPALQPLQSLRFQVADRVRPGRVVARLRDGTDESDLTGRHGVTVESRGHGNAFVILRGAVGNERALAARLGADAEIEWAEPDYLRQPIAVDPRLWAFYNPGGLLVEYTRGRKRPVTSYVSTEDADIDNAEGIGSSGTPVLVGSIDSGIDYDHPEFAGVDIQLGSDWYDNDDDPSDSDDHGTHTSGTMVGNNVGVAGVAGAPVGLYVQRVCGPLGCPLSAIASAIREATDAGVVAMNLSLGGSSLSQAEAAAIDYAVANHVLVVASAGNGGVSTVSCPACDPGAISVSATNWQDELSYYSSYGSGLDLAAPGGELYSNTTDEAGIWSSVRNGGYAYFQGTSMAAPHVTGVAGVVASVEGLRGAALRARLEGTADDLGSGGYDTTFGHGRVNLAAALGGGSEPPPPPPPPPSGPTAAFTYDCSGLTCSFDAGGSSGTGNLGYSWDFGDGTADTGETASHTYPASRSKYTVVLTVSDDNGTAQANEQINCGRRRGVLDCR